MRKTLGLHEVLELIDRSRLEDWLPLSDARALAEEFFGDQVSYPDHDFYSRKRGINKDIPEEFYPLLQLAEHLPDSTDLRLSPDSVSGPDGAIRFGDESVVTVQITLSHERTKGYEVRHSLRDNGSWSSDGFETGEVIALRLDRIVESITDKEAKYRDGTDVLLVVDQSISWGDVIDPALPQALAVAVSTLPQSKYSSTYVAFGEDVRPVR